MDSQLAVIEQRVVKDLTSYLVKGSGTFSCCNFHPLESCHQRNLTKLIGIMKSLLKINLPIHIIPALIFKLKTMQQKPLSSAMKLAINIMRSVLFLTSFVIVIHMLQCYGSRIPHTSQWSLNLIASAVSGFGIAFEQPHKRVEITYYCIPKTLEALWNFFEKRNFVLTFALSMGIIAICYGDGKNPKTLRGFSLKACNSLWKETDEQISEKQ